MELNAIKYMERAARDNAAVISLGQGIPSFHLDPALRRAAIEAIASGMADAYSDPQGIPRLRHLIARQLQAQNMNYDAAEIIITAGAIEGLNVALQSVVRPGASEVIVPTPVYGAYFNLIEAARGTAVQLPLDEAQNWRLDVALLRQKITKNTAAILLCNPNNPTGTIYDKATLREVAAIAKEAGIALIIDEVYRNMLYEGQAVYSPAEEPEFKQTVIRIMSFSKDFAMTGWRTGYIQADTSRISDLVARHDSLISCAPVISQYVSCAAIMHEKRILETNQKMYNDRRTLMAGYLDQLSDHLSYSMPRGGYYFFPRFKAQQTSSELAGRILEHKLVIVPGESFGEGGQGHIRLCFGRSEQAINEGMARLVQYYHAK